MNAPAELSAQARNECEQAVLGAALAYGEVAPELEPRDFHNKFHRRLWAAILDVQRDGLTVETRIVAQKLNGFSEENADYISDLYENSRGTANLLHYAGKMLGRRISTGIGVTTVEDVMSTDEPDLEWIIDGLLFRGGFSLLSGRPKSGKSTLARNMAAALANGDEFLGRTTTECRTLIVSLEEHRAGLKAEWLKLNKPTHGRVSLSIGMPEDMGQFPRLLAETVKRDKPDMVVVDHLGHAARADDLNDYAKVRAALEPYRQLARISGAHVMLLHHSKKQGGDHGGEALGSTAITGLVDTALMIGITSERREIYSINRHGEALDKTLLDFDKERGALDAGPTVEQHKDREREQEIIDYLGDQSDGQTNMAIAAQVEMSPNKVLKLLRRLCEAGHVTLEGTGKRGDPFLYSISDPIG